MENNIRVLLENIGLDPDEVPGGLIAIERRISQQIIFPAIVNHEVTDAEKYGLWVVKRLYDYLTGENSNNSNNINK